MTVHIAATKGTLRWFLLEKSGLLHQNLQGPPPTKNDVLDVVKRLECVQIDPVAAVERNQHLALSARMPRYQPDLLNSLLASKDVFETMANALCAIPMEDYPIFESTRARLRTRLAEELDTYKDSAREILARLEREGPLPAKAFEANHRVHGYWDNQAPKTKITSHVLNLLTDSSVIRVVERQGNTRLFDLTERTVPHQLLEASSVISMEESQLLLLEKYMRAYRIFDLSDARFGWQYDKVLDRKAKFEPYLNRGFVVPLHIEGVRTTYYALAEDLPFLEELTNDEGRKEPQTVRFLPPLDNLLWRRPRLVDLFDFDYKWEIYTPATKRQYGYYAMPILYGSRLIGRIDPLLDRKNQQLIIENLQLEPGTKVTKRLQSDLWKELRRFATFHGARDIEIRQSLPVGIHLES